MLCFLSLIGRGHLDEAAHILNQPGPRQDNHAAGSVSQTILLLHKVTDRTHNLPDKARYVTGSFKFDYVLVLGNKARGA